MRKEKFHAKIHRATVTGADLDYEGSVTVGKNLLEASGIDEYERVQIVNVSNGERLETYVIEGGDGEVRLNGAAARLCEVGDTVIVIAYATYDEDEVPDPTVVHVDEGNEVVSVD
ncbi:MAG: aspartate 1-decarboxylase [Halobacteria archaeon]|nr:aspartate 1-decarboxylase [Halobacteria archaeon]